MYSIKCKVSTFPADALLRIDPCKAGAGPSSIFPGFWLQACEWSYGTSTSLHLYIITYTTLVSSKSSFGCSSYWWMLLRIFRFSISSSLLLLPSAFPHHHGFSFSSFLVVIIIPAKSVSDSDYRFREDHCSCSSSSLFV